jgi:hypothetical protein
MPLTDISHKNTKNLGYLAIFLRFQDTGIG